MGESICRTFIQYFSKDSPLEWGQGNQLRRNKKPGGEVANPHAGFLNINLVSLADLAVGDPISVSSRLPT